MHHQRRTTILLACIIGLLPLLLLTSLTATAQGGGPLVRPTPVKGPSPTPTPKTPSSPARPQAVLPVDLSNLRLSMRGAHAGQVAQVTAIVPNNGTALSTDTRMRATIPSHTTYVSGSAAVQGGGTLAVGASQIDWSGAIPSGGRITVTFNVTLPLTSLPITSTVTASDPDYPYLAARQNSLQIQPASLGPDAFGYTVKDSFAPGGPAYQFVPKTITATQLSFSDIDDGIAGPAALNFNFAFYGTNYAQVFVSTNGLVGFGAGSTAYQNAPIPNTGLPNNYATCFWRDQTIVPTAQGVWLQTFGNAPNRTTIIQFLLTDFDYGGLGEAPYLYEMILHETSNIISCEYADTSSILEGSGGHATIGLENADGSAGIQYFASTDDTFETVGPLRNQLAVQFQPGPASLPIYAASQAQSSFNVHPGEVATLTIAMRNTGTATGTATSMNDPLPAGATYVPGSATVQGGGVLSANASAVNWSGVVTPGLAVTVTYRITNSLVVGTPITNTATISDPAAAIPIKVASSVRVGPLPAAGPDAYGYTYKDSYAPGGPIFTWLSHTITATSLFTTGNDDFVTGPLPLEFSFNFYGNAYTGTYVSSNGLVMFGADSAAETNYPIPTPDAPNNWASCFWSDLVPADNSQGAWMQTFGSAPNRTAVITFRLSDFGAPDPAVAHEFQMVLSETTNRILCQYLDIGDNISGTGSIATIGLESPDGTAGLQYWDSYDPDFLTIGPVENGLAVLYSPDTVPHAVFANSNKSVSSGEHPGEVVTYTMHVINSGPAPAATTIVSDPIPSGATYIPGSATVQGGGALSANASAVNWNGPITSGAAVTLTYRVTLTALSGTVMNQAAITSPQATLPMVITTVTPIQPYSAPADSLHAAYVYHDSYAPGGPQFSWVPTTVLGTQLFPITADDSISGPVALGFPFNFYGQTYTQVVVSSNGLVMFNRSGAADSDNAPIPTLNYVNNYATCFWDNLTTFAGGGVWFETQSVAGGRRAVITFAEYEVAAPVDPPLLFQMILSENGSRITCQYQQMQGAASGDGRSATVGVQNIRSDDGLQYTFGSNSASQRGPLENGLAIEFAPPPKLYLPVIAR